MNIAFSTEWFLTIPGILITCGVILLIIALIMFIVGSTKGKKNKEMPKVEAPVGAVQPQVQVQPVDNVQPVVQPESQENSFIKNNEILCFKVINFLNVINWYMKWYQCDKKLIRNNYSKYFGVLRVEEPFLQIVFLLLIILLQMIYLFYL